MGIRINHGPLFAGEQIAGGIQEVQLRNGGMGAVVMSVLTDNSNVTGLDRSAEFDFLLVCPLAKEPLCTSWPAAGATGLPTRKTSAMAGSC